MHHDFVSIILKNDKYDIDAHVLDEIKKKKKVTYTRICSNGNLNYPDKTMFLIETRLKKNMIIKQNENIFIKQTYILFIKFLSSIFNDLL